MVVMAFDYPSWIAPPMTGHAHIREKVMLLLSSKDPSPAIGKVTINTF